MVFDNCFICNKILINFVGRKKNVFLLKIFYFSICLTSNKLYWIEDQLAAVSTRFYMSASWHWRVEPSASWLQFARTIYWVVYPWFLSVLEWPITFRLMTTFSEIGVCPWPDLSSLFQYTSPTPVVSLHLIPRIQYHPGIPVTLLTGSSLIKRESLIFSLRQYCLDFLIFIMIDSKFHFSPTFTSNLFFWTRNKNDICLKHMTSSTLVKCNSTIISIVMPSGRKLYSKQFLIFC